MSVHLQIYSVKNKYRNENDCKWCEQIVFNLNSLKMDSLCEFIMVPTHLALTMSRRYKL